MRKVPNRDARKAVRSGLCLAACLSLLAVIVPAQVAVASPAPAVPDPDMFITAGVDQTVAATSEAGAPISLVAFPTAVDDGEPVAVVCDNPSIFPPGLTVVHCSATDPDADSSPLAVVTTHFNVTVTAVPDTDLAITPGANQTVVATSEAGAPASLVAFPTAVDDGAPVTVVCDNPTIFPPGLTVVHCSATDPDADSSPLAVVTTHFNVTVTAVPDTDLAITPGANQTVVATSGAGAPASSVDFPTAVDDGAPVTVVCDNPAFFLPGLTVVHCSATDPDADSSPLAVVTTHFNVTVTDTDLAITPGVSPAPVTGADPTNGAPVTFAVPTATDEDGPVTVTCDHASGQWFLPGSTTVTCSATDPDDTPSTVHTTLTVSVTAASAPTAPTNVTASAGNQSVSVSFGPPDYNGSLPVTSYKADCVGSDGSSGSNSNTGQTTPITVGTLHNGVSYTCTVTASNHLGAGPPSDRSNPVVPDVVVTCTSDQTCNAMVSNGNSSGGPPQTTQVTGTIDGSFGNLVVTVAKVLSSCPGVPPSVAPVTTVADSGFSSDTNLTVTVTQLASVNGAGKICYTKDTPFLSESNPVTPKAGTAILLACTATGGIAPCQVSSTVTSTSITVVFLIPGGDPKFRVVVPKGLVLWPSSLPAGKVGAAYSSRLQSSGGKAPVHWKVTSGKLAPGLTLNTTTGAITGKPKTKGVFKCQVKGTDSGAPAKSASIGVSITIK